MSSWLFGRFEVILHTFSGLSTFLPLLILVYLLRAAKWLLVLSLFSVLFFRFVPVPVTPLMLQRCFEHKLAGEGMRLQHDWVPLSRISPYLQLAVVCSEDQNFLVHDGLDFEAIEKAQKENKRKTKRKRGASTIPQQTAKNVFLWPARSWVRKGFEVYFTALIEVGWSKQRIMEVYLNSIERATACTAPKRPRASFSANPPPVCRPKKPPSSRPACPTPSR